MNRLRRCRALFVLACLAAGGTGAGAAETLAVGAPFPDLRAVGLEGDLPDLTKARVVIVDFWASWCGPCKASFPVYSELQKQFADAGVVFVAVSVDRDARAMRAFLDRNPPAFAVVRDAQQQLVSAVGVPTMPTAFVLDRHGVVRHIHAGFHDKTSRLEYLEEIRRLLEEES